MELELRQILAKYGYKEVYQALIKEAYYSYIYLRQVFEKATCCIYGIYHTTNGSCIYVGCTFDLINRILWHQHDSPLYPNRKLYTIIREAGGWKYFTFRILEKIYDITYIYLREKHFISLLSPSGNTISPPDKLILFA